MLDMDTQCQAERLSKAYFSFAPRLDFPTSQLAGGIQQAPGDSSRDLFYPQTLGWSPLSNLWRNSGRVFSLTFSGQGQVFAELPGIDCFRAIEDYWNILPETNMLAPENGRLEHCIASFGAV